MAERSARSTAAGVSAFLIAALLPAAAFGAGSDRLAEQIWQSLAGVEMRLEYSPDQAERDLQQQERLVDLLASEAPDNARLPELRERIAELEHRLAEARSGGPVEGAKALLDDAPPDKLPTDELPKEFDDGLDEVNRLASAAEADLYQGKVDQAADQLARAGEAIQDLEGRYADQIPLGHVPLIVAQERIAALKDQLGDARSSD